MSLAPKLRIEEVGRSFTGRRGGVEIPALLPTSITIEDHTFVSLLGPSGCGKSTLLRIVAGLDRGGTGTVLLDGVPVQGPGPERGMVFQSYTLFPWLTVRQNICFGLRERKVPVPRQKEIAAFFIERTGLGGFEDHFPRMLSGGMQQRTALARALANDPKVLLLDEPFGALDHQTRGLMQELLLSIWQADRKTVMFVTHDIEEAVFLSTRVLVMTARPGRIKTDIPIALPYPRPYTIKASSAFNDYRLRLTDDLRAEAIVAQGSQPVL